MKRCCGAILILTLAVLSGCGGAKPNNGGDDGRYTLEILAEKNLDTGLDHLYVRFLRDGLTVSEGYVMVDGDSLTMSASGQASRIYPGDHFTHMTDVLVHAADPDNSFSFQAAVRMPGSVAISDITSPANRIWRPGTGNVSLTWFLADMVTGYFISVQPRSAGSPAPGLTELVAGGSYTFSPLDAFYNPVGGELVADIYDIQIIGYNQTYVRRALPSPTYKSPNAAFPVTTQTSTLTARVGAAVVTARESVSAEPLNP